MGHRGRGGCWAKLHSAAERVQHPLRLRISTNPCLLPMTAALTSTSQHSEGRQWRQRYVQPTHPWHTHKKRVPLLHSCLGVSVD